MSFIEDNDDSLMHNILWCVEIDVDTQDMKYLCILTSRLR